MKNLLIELYSEELPAKMQAKAEEAYTEIFSKFFEHNQITYNKLQIFIGPCRIVIQVQIQEIIPASYLAIKGPKIDANSIAIEGFCKKNGCRIQDLAEEIIGEHSFYTLKKQIPEKQSIDLLREHFEDLMRKFVWPKTMVWGNYSFPWIRPLKSILCIFEDKIIDLKLSHIDSGNKSFGHKFMTPGSVEISTIPDYFEFMAKSGVILDRNKRKSIILNSMEEICAKLDLIFHCDENLLEEIAGLCEFPVVLYGKIDSKFMDLPKEVLITSLKNHQKYFTANTRSGSLAPYFFFATNLRLENYEHIISGNSIVLSARLSDALYFYNKDLATTQEERFQQLANIIYHQKLGTMQDKALRIETIVSVMDNSLKAAGRYAKADLCSEMVGEFPELQGIMGGYYSKAEGIEEYEAIRDHYLPEGVNDEVPNKAASIVSIADKLDSLVSLYIAGERATGSGDSYGLRRYAIGIIRSIQCHNLEINIRDLVILAASLCKLDYQAQDIEGIIIFMQDRMKNFLKNQVPIEILNAAINLVKNPDILSNIKVAYAINQVIASEKGKSLVALYKRAKNILAGLDTIDLNLFQDFSPAESNLLKIIDDIDRKIAEHIASKNYEASLDALLELESPLNNFFKDNLINSEDANTTQRRKSILAKASSLFEQILDFSLL